MCKPNSDLRSTHLCFSCFRWSARWPPTREPPFLACFDAKPAYLSRKYEPPNILPEGRFLHRRLGHDGYNYGSRGTFTPSAVPRLQQSLKIAIRFVTEIFRVLIIVTPVQLSINFCSITLFVTFVKPHAFGGSRTHTPYGARA